MADLKLFVISMCPYCLKVTNFLKEEGIEVEVLNISKDPKAKEELKRIGGKVQAPMLLVDGKPLYESDDIIEWFKKNK
jgi:glutaredoxin